jgi:hypothetical protein
MRSSLSDCPSKPLRTFTHTMGYSRSGMMTISKTRGGFGMLHSKCWRGKKQKVLKLHEQGINFMKPFRTKFMDKILKCKILILKNILLYCFLEPL